MNFSIRDIQENGLSLVELQDLRNNTRIQVLPNAGALLHLFEVINEGSPINIIDNYKDKEELDASLDRSYKSSKLAPFVCRIPEGKYNWGGVSYEFEHKFMDGSAIHGLLFNKPFSVVERFIDDENASIHLRYHYNKDDAGYPFRFNCDITYTLGGNNLLQVETTILNLDDIEIPVADGWHPYFTLGNKVNDCLMRFESDQMLEFNKQLIPTGKLLPYPDFLEFKQLGPLFLDNCFLSKAEPEQPVCQFHNPANGLTLSFYSDGSYPYLQIYTPDHRNSIAIENLSGAPDCYNNGMGLQILEPRHSETFNVWYKVDVKQIK